MIIRLYPENNALPIGPAVNRVGSALPLRIIGAPSGATSVAVSVFNADGTACNLDATRHGGEWVTTVPASHFASWGKVPRGLQVAVSYKDETDTTQTVVFVGDVRIEKTAAGDPEGTGKRSVPVTEVDEVADGSSMKDIRDKVNELARIVSGTATALVLMALPLSAATPLEDIPGTNEVYTAAETDAAISNAIAQIPPPAAGGVSTNDVCAIVTNEVDSAGAWRLSGDELPPNATVEWKQYDANSNPYTQATGIELPYTEGWYLIFGASRDKLDVFSFPFCEDPNAIDIGASSGDTGYEVIASRADKRNALGLAQEKDLPQKTPVDELLLNGADGKVYHLRIGAGGSIDIYTEVTP